MKGMLKTSTALVGLAAFMTAMGHGAPAWAQEAPKNTQQNDQIEEISVTGSYIRRKSQKDTASPIQVVDNEDLRAAGVTTISDFANQLTVNNGAQNNPDAVTQNVSAGTSNINLRGLGVASTLVLLNGKRTVTSGAQTDGGVSFVDTSSLIPPIAIGQVEVLKDGAGPLYGSDAVAGVVNFKTRSDFEGLEVSSEVKHITGTDQKDVTVGAIAGWKNDTMNFMAAVNYFDRNNLSQRDRDLRTEEALARNVSISLTSGYPGTFLLPTAPVGNLTDTIAFLSVYDQMAPQWTNPASALGIPPVVPSGQPPLPVPPEFAALGITTNAGVPFLPFPSGVPGVPGSVFAGFAPADAAAGQGIINIPGPAAAFLGLGDGSSPIAIGADGVADALTSLVYGTVMSDPNTLAALGAGLGVPGSLLSYDSTAFPGNVDGAPLPTFADPYCRQVAQQYEDVIPLINDFTNPLNGETSPVGACGYDFNNQFDLVPDEERLQAYAEFSADISDSLELYSSFGYSRNRTERGNSNFPITIPVGIAANNPFNIFRSDVLWLGRSGGS